MLNLLHKCEKKILTNKAFIFQMSDKTKYIK